MLAHELGHIKHRDTLLMTITATIAGAISMLANFGFYFGGRSNNNGNIGFIGSLLLLILGPLAAGLVQMAISRTREYEADREGAEISKRPLALASALAEDRRRGAADPQHAGRAQSGLGASLHRQSAVGRAHGQSVLDPPERREPRGAARRRSRARWARAAAPAVAPSSEQASGPVGVVSFGCAARALGLGPYRQSP